jgi:hypothetical protein
MLKTLELLKHKLFISYEVLDFKQGEDFYYLKIKAVLVDNSELHIREYVTEADYLYSYHWQDLNGTLRIRWDNSPHHRQIRTFPHHKHTPELEESFEVGLEDILRIIEARIKGNSLKS